MNAIIPPVPVETIGNATLYLADCRNVLSGLGLIDAVVTDPPYGINLSGKRGHYRNQPNARRSDVYSSYEDTQENFVATVLPPLRYALSVAKRGAVFMAERTLPLLPAWDALGGIFLPNGCGVGRWGFQCFMHCALYGKDPFTAARKGSRPNGKHGIYGNDANKIDHPCAKPLAAMLWAVERATASDDVVVDPFMGSGTTGVACIKAGRRFIGIEIEPRYFDTACRRIEEAQRQADMFPASKEDPSFMRTSDLLGDT
jgi:site-specific DNA-methyltransferase (adenine-specific)